MEIDAFVPGCSNRSEETVMFRTALGKPVRVGQSSVAKALSVLGEDADDAGVGQGISFSSLRCLNISIVYTIVKLIIL